jgi:uncharacterized protein (TIGR02453 family)
MMYAGKDDFVGKTGKAQRMSKSNPIFTEETFKFFKQLKRNNHLDWMKANRDRYRAAVVEPFRKLCEEMAPMVLGLDSRFDTCGRTGANFSRINRDIRFAKDKTLYKTHMYLKFSIPLPGDRESGQLYSALSIDTVTAGFRIYSGAKRKEGALAMIATPRLHSDPRWVTKQKKRLGRRYESYWYTTEKGEWTKHEGWPESLDNWKKIGAWIVRRKLSTRAALSATFPRELAKTFRELYPILKFVSLPGQN